MSQSCSRCGVSLPPGARFCEGCGTPAGTAALTPLPVVGALDKRSDPVTLPSPEKDLLTPLPATGFPPSTPRTASLTTQPQPLYGAGFPSASATSPLVPWQWAAAVIAGAVFLYNTSVAIGLTLFLLSGNGSSALGGRVLVSLALAGVAGFGLIWVLQDRKVVLAFLLGGISLRSLIRVLAIIFTTQSFTLLFEWLVVGAAATSALWWLWKQSPREAGDGSRLALALTVLIAAELSTITYGIVVNPAYLRSVDLVVALVVTGALVVLRLKLPAFAPGSEAARISSGIDPRFRRVLMIVAYIVIAVILRVLLRSAFR